MHIIPTLQWFRMPCGDLIKPSWTINRGHPPEVCSVGDDGTAWEDWSNNINVHQLHPWDHEWAAFLHIRKKRKCRHQPPGVTTANTNTLLQPLLFIMQSVTPATHTHLPLLLHANTQFAPTKYHLQCSEGVDEKDPLDKFWQIYQQTERVALCAHGLCARCFVSWWQSTVPVLL